MRTSFICLLIVLASYSPDIMAAEPAKPEPKPEKQPALQIVGGPYLQAPAATSMTLVWRTNRKCTPRVEYGPSADELTKVAVSARHGLIDANTTLHRIAISELQPGTTYHYRVISTEIVEFRAYRVTYGESVESRGTFTTLDPNKESFSFCVINDRHDKADELRQALGSVDWQGVDLVFALGDVMNDPMSEEQIFEKFINPCVEYFASNIPMVLVRGNHEARGLMARHLMDYFPTESGRYYYSFDHGGVHFLLLDGGEDKHDTHPSYGGLTVFEQYVEKQTEWLARELRTPAFRDARFRVCLLHIPPVVTRPKDQTEFIRAPWIRDVWTPMLGKAGIDLMLSGHTHRYAELAADEQRAFPIVVGGIDTVIRVDVSPQRLSMTTFKNDGTLLSQPPEVPRK